MRNRQTCTIGHLHLILPVVALVNLETLEITRQVIGGTRVQVPVLLVGGGRCSVAGALVLIIALAAVTSLMLRVFANLALGAPLIRAFYIIIYTLHIGIIGMFYQCYVIVLHVLDDFTPTPFAFIGDEIGSTSSRKTTS